MNHFKKARAAIRSWPIWKQKLVQGLSPAPDDKILFLTVKKQWFDKIASGEKKVEYREAKPYWNKRLNREFNKIIFKNGYAKTAPSLIADFAWMCVIEGKDTDLAIDSNVYAIGFRNVRPYYNR